MLLNVLLKSLILENMDFPEMEYKGAAIATTIGNTVIFVAYSAILLQKVIMESIF